MVDEVLQCVRNNQVEEAKPGDSKSSVSSLRPPWTRVCKRAVDILVAVLALILLAPLFLIISILIKLHDGGPVFYRRRVVGPVGSFDAFKFRSMHPAADRILRADVAMKETFEENFKLKDDPRVTELGAFLRKHSLDELPQLVNVLCGQMSLVGPRMITAEELAKYGEHQQLL